MSFLKKVAVIYMVTNIITYCLRQAGWASSPAVAGCIVHCHRVRRHPPRRRIYLFRVALALRPSPMAFLVRNFWTHDPRYLLGSYRYLIISNKNLLVSLFVDLEFESPQNTYKSPHQLLPRSTLLPSTIILPLRPNIASQGSPRGGQTTLGGG